MKTHLNTKKFTRNSKKCYPIKITTHHNQQKQTAAATATAKSKETQNLYRP
jgi:ribosomal protein S17E